MERESERLLKGGRSFKRASVVLPTLATAAQEALREKEREQRKLAEDEGGGWKKGLWKSHTMTG